MKIFKFICIGVMFLFLSCGKSPLLNRKSNEVTGNFGLESQKTFPGTGINLNISWITGINSTDAGIALLISTKNGALVDLPIPYSIYLWMPSMNHGSSPITINHLSTGVYKLIEIYFIMDGDWQLRTQLKSGNGVQEEIFFEYNL